MIGGGTLVKLDFYNAFSATLKHQKFDFNGDKYDNVEDCLTRRNICSKLWNPTEVPLLHKYKLDRYAFMIYDFEDEFVSAIIYDDVVNCDIVKMLLFIKYFRQIYTNHESMMRSKFFDAYCVCSQTLSSIEVSKETIQCCKYRPEFISNDCIFVCSRSIKNQKIDAIDEIVRHYDTVNISVSHEDDITQTVTQLIRRNRRTKFNIYNNIVEYSVVLDRLSQMNENVEIIDDILTDTDNYDIYMCGTTRADFVVNDWNRVYIIE